MKKLNLTERKGFAQIFLLVGMLLVAVSLPIATKLVQQNQENRSKAASTCSCSKGTYSTESICKGNGGVWKCTTTCTYTCYTWSSCKVDGSSLSGGSQVCLTETKTPSGCTGGSKKVGSTRNCTPVAPTPTKKPECTVATYNRTCTAGKEKYCGAGNKIVTYTCPYGSCKSNTACGDCNDTTNQGCSTGYHCVSGSCVKDAAQKPAQCGSKNGGTMDHAPNGTEACYEGAIGFPNGTAPSNGTYKWTCTGVGTGNVANCSANSIASNETYYYYSSSTKTCFSTKDYASITACYAAKGVCYRTSDECTTLSSCRRIGGTCRGVCGSDESADSNGHYECQPGRCCILKPGTTKKDGKCGSTAPTATAPNSSAACEVGNVNWIDIVGTSGTFMWKCEGVVGGATVPCSAAKVTPTPTKKPGSGSGSGGSSPGYSYPALVVIPSALTLKVGESATVTASDTVTWSSDKADIAMVTADGVVVGVAVGTATITATNEFGETAKVAVSVITKGTGTLSFKVAFAGIKPSYTNSLGESYSCIGSLGSLTVEILNRPTNTYGKFSDIKVSVVGNEIDSKGNQVFQASNLEVGSSFATVNNFNYVKIKGPFHLKRRMCKDGQTGKLDETTTCDISLLGTDGYIYDFSEYTLLAGDVDLNGVINSVDFSLVKNAVNADAEPSCGRGNDLNMDGVVNALDLNLVKDSLSSIDDE